MDRRNLIRSGRAGTDIDSKLIKFLEDEHSAIGAECFKVFQKLQKNGVLAGIKFGCVWAHTKYKTWKFHAKYRGLWVQAHYITYEDN